jgi:hypothetical protein
LATHAVTWRISLGTTAHTARLGPVPLPPRADEARMLSELITLERGQGDGVVRWTISGRS